MEAQLSEVVGAARSPDGHGGMIGRSCGGYRITRLLGEGGMGQVYLGVNEHLGKRAAIKILLPAHSVRMRAESRFLQEARAAAQIDDPNIVDILDASEFPDGRFYILMPFIEGSSLDELCDRLGPLPIDVAAEILLQICGGLDAAHRHGIVHRDIKPQNILVGPRQQRQHFATIVDFGIAKLLDADLAINVHTESKAMIGTPGYMAPEQARGSRDIDARVDVYAVGTVAYRILTGRTPYLDETLYGLIEKQITNAPFPTPRQLRPNIPALWEQAILSALVIDRNRRLSSVKEFAEMIARGIPRGEHLARTLVPQLSGPMAPPDALAAEVIDANGAASSHSALTVAGKVTAPMITPMGVPVATTSDSAPRPSRAAKAATFSLALALASGLGSMATYAAMSDVEHAAPPAPNTRAVAALEPSNAPDVAEESSDEPPQRHEPPAEIAKRAAERVEPAKAQIEPAQATVDAPPLPKAAAPSPPAPAKAASTAPSPAITQAAAKPKQGIVVIRVKTWAAVLINDQDVGYAPVRKELPPGQYRITLKNDGHQEVVKQTVAPGKTATIAREW